MTTEMDTCSLISTTSSSGDSDNYSEADMDFHENSTESDSEMDDIISECCTRFYIGDGPLKVDPVVLMRDDEGALIDNIDIEIPSSEKEIELNLPMPRLDDHASVEFKENSKNEVIESDPNRLDMDNLEDLHSKDSKFCEAGEVKFKNSFIMDYLREEKIKADTIIRLKDGSIGAHKLVLAAVSPFLGSMLIEQADKALATIIIPDVRKKTMKKIIEFIYTGKMEYKSKEGEKIQTALGLLRLMACTGYQVTEIEHVAQSNSLTATLDSIVEKSAFLCPTSGTEELTKMLIPPGPGSEVSGISDATTLPVNEQEYMKESQDICQNPDSFYSVTRNRDFRCNFCSKLFKSMGKIFIHLDSFHKDSTTVLPISDKEMEIITRCDFCHKRCQSSAEANECLKRHSLSRCWACLKIFDRELIRQHYLMDHVDERTKDDARNTYIKCRWCHYLLNIRTNITNVAKHASSHLEDYPKFGRKRRYEEFHDTSEEYSEDLQNEPFEIENTIAKEEKLSDTAHRFRTVKLNTLEQFQLPTPPNLPSVQPSFVMNERGKVNINLRKLPKFSAEIPEIPKAAVQFLRQTD